MDSPDRDRRDLTLLIQKYIANYLPAGPDGEEVVSSLVDFYHEAKRLSATELFDGADHRIHFSIRTLTRYVTVRARPCQHSFTGPCLMPPQSRLPMEFCDRCMKDWS